MFDIQAASYSIKYLNDTRDKATMIRSEMKFIQFGSCLENRHKASSNFNLYTVCDAFLKLELSMCGNEFVYALALVPYIVTGEMGTSSKAVPDPRLKVHNVNRLKYLDG